MDATLDVAYQMTGSAVFYGCSTPKRPLRIIQAKWQLLFQDVPHFSFDWILNMNLSNLSIKHFLTLSNPLYWIKLKMNNVLFSAPLIAVTTHLRLYWDQVSTDTNFSIRLLVCDSKLHEISILLRSREHRIKVYHFHPTKQDSECYLGSGTLQRVICCGKSVWYPYQVASKHV